MAIAAYGLVAIPSNVSRAFQIVSLMVSKEWNDDAPFINGALFWIGFAAVMVCALLVLGVARHFFRGSPEAPKVLINALSYLVGLLTTLVFIPLLRLFMEQLHCAIPSYMAAAWCWSPAHDLRMSLAIVALVVFIPTSLVVVVNQFPADPNSRDPLKRINSLFDSFVFIMKIVVVAVEVFVSQYSKMASLATFAALGMVTLIFLNLLQPYYHQSVNRIRSALFGIFTVFSLTGACIIDADLSEEAFNAILFAPILPVGIVFFFSVRVSAKHIGIGYWLKRLFAPLVIGYSAAAFHDLHLEKLLKSPERLGKYAYFAEKVLHDQDTALHFYSQAELAGIEGGHSRDFAHWSNEHALFDAGSPHDGDLWFLEVLSERLPQGSLLTISTPELSDIGNLFFHWRLRMYERGLKVLWAPSSGKWTAKKDTGPLPYPQQLMLILCEVFGGVRSIELSRAHSKRMLEKWAWHRRKTFSEGSVAILGDLVAGTASPDVTVAQYAHAFEEFLMSMTTCSCRVLRGKQALQSSLFGSLELSSKGSLSNSTTEAEVEEMETFQDFFSVDYERQPLAVLFEDNENDPLSRSIFLETAARLANVPVIFVLHTTHSRNDRPTLPPSVRALRGLPEFRLTASAEKAKATCLGDCNRSCIGPDLKPFCPLCELLNAPFGDMFDGGAISMVPPNIPPANGHPPANGANGNGDSETLLRRASLQETDDESETSEYQTACDPEIRSRPNALPALPGHSKKLCKEKLLVRLSLFCGSNQHLRDFLDIAAVCGRSRPVRALATGYRRFTRSSANAVSQMFAKVEAAGLIRLSDARGTPWFSWTCQAYQHVLLVHLTNEERERYRDLNFLMADTYQQRHHWKMHTTRWVVRHLLACWAVPRLLPLVLQDADKFTRYAATSIPPFELAIVLLDWLVQRQKIVTHTDLYMSAGGANGDSGGSLLSRRGLAHAAKVATEHRPFLPERLMQYDEVREIQEYGYDPDGVVFATEGAPMRLGGGVRREAIPVVSTVKAQDRFTVLYNLATHRAHLTDGADVAMMALNLAEEYITSECDRCKLLATWGRVLYLLGRADEGRKFADAAYNLAVSHMAADPKKYAEAAQKGAFLRGYISRRERNEALGDNALLWYTRALSFARQSGKGQDIARTLSALAMAERDAGQLRLAVEHCNEACDLFLWLGMPHWYVDTLHSLGQCYTLLGQPRKAVSVLMRGIQIGQSFAPSVMFLQIMESLVDIGVCVGDVDLLTTALAGENMLRWDENSVDFKVPAGVLLCQLRCVIYFHAHSLDKDGNVMDDVCVRVNAKTQLCRIPGAIEYLERALSAIRGGEVDLLEFVLKHIQQKREYLKKVEGALSQSHEENGLVAHARVSLIIIANYIEKTLEELKDERVRLEACSLPIEDVDLAPSNSISSVTVQPLDSSPISELQQGDRSDESFTTFQC